MARFSGHIIVALVVDVALLVFLCLHIQNLFHRPGAPFTVSGHSPSIQIDEILDPVASDGLQQNDIVLTWGDLSLSTNEEVEFLADFHEIQDRIHVRYQRDGATSTAEISLIPYYGLSYIISIYLLGFITWCVGVFVLLRKGEERVAKILHWSMVSMAVVVMASWEGRGSQVGFAIPLGALFFTSYAGVAATFLLLTTEFPVPSSKHFGARLVAIYGPAIALIIPLVYYNSVSIVHGSVEDFLKYQWWFDLFHVSLILYIVGGIANFTRAYIRSSSVTERKKLKWILFGLCAGPTPFLFLTILPRLLNVGWSVLEGYTLIFLVAIPVTFAISFVKYHVMDVEVVLNRATVYTIVLGTITAVYVLTVTSVADMAGGKSMAISAVAALIVGLLIHPFRTLVQRFVDRRFFRVQYNFRETERSFLDEIKRALDLRELATLIVRRTDELIPIERIGFFTLRESGHRLVALAQRNYDLLQKHGVHFDVDNLRTRLQLPLALHERVEQGVHFEQADEAVFRRWGMALVFPLHSQASDYFAFLVLGAKKSGARFTIEDVDLLRNVTAQASLSIDRFNLQRELLLEQAELQRLEELSRMKSDFVSYVSHELRTPLTSIKLFSELLADRLRGVAGFARRYLTVINEEADRLDRMVNTILDSARIEQGVKEYTMTEIDLRTTAGRVLKAMRFQLRQHGFRVKFSPGQRPLCIQADPDAVAQAIINLIANAIKYSAERRYVNVSLRVKDGSALCCVQDRGLGISPESIPRLFERFYRDPKSRDTTKGIGLGLALVKHIMDAHGGKVSVSSVVGRGSTFTLTFPLVNSGKHRATSSHQKLPEVHK